MIPGEPPGCCICGSPEIGKGEYKENADGEFICVKCNAEIEWEELPCGHYGEVGGEHSGNGFGICELDHGTKH